MGVTGSVFEIGGALPRPASQSSTRPAELEGVLGDITRDEPIITAAACTIDLTLLTKAPGFLGQLACKDTGARVRHLDEREYWLRKPQKCRVPMG